jgi:hypothetical protein
LILQLFQGCVQGFSLWRKGEDLASDALVFMARLEMQAVKFKAWGLDWGFDRGPDGAYWRHERFQRDGDLAVKYIVIIHSLLDELRELSADFPSLASAETVPISAATSIGNILRLAFKDSTEREQWATKLQIMREEAGAPEKLRWALREGNVNETLERLRSMIDDLCSHFKPPKEDLVSMHVLNSLLSSVSILTLNAVAEAANEDSALRNLALLKAKVVQLQLGGGRAEDVDERSRSLSEAGEILDKRTNSWRSMGTFRRTTNVLVEWKLVDGSRPPPGHSSSTYRAMAERRIKNLASLLKSSSRLAEMRTLDCVGVVTRELASDHEVQFGMMFRVPSLKYVTLKAILEGSHEGMVLGDWFKIAHSVSRAVLCLHLAGWLHKGIRSENILYFVDGNGKIPYADPILAGFEYTREASAQGQTESVTDDLEANLYRHPDVQGVPQEPADTGGQQTSQAQTPARPSFGMKHDIFGVGMVLLELGTQRSALKMYDEAVGSGEYGRHSAVAFQDWVVAKEIPKLGGLRGADYMMATAWCVKSEFDGTDTEELQRSFYKDVVRGMGSFGGVGE